MTTQARGIDSHSLLLMTARRVAIDRALLASILEAFQESEHKFLHPQICIAAANAGSINIHCGLLREPGCPSPTTPHHYLTYMYLFGGTVRLDETSSIRTELSLVAATGPLFLTLWIAIMIILVSQKMVLPRNERGERVVLGTNSAVSRPN